MNIALIIAIVVMALMTWLIRALPFIYLHLKGKKINFSEGRLIILGPALLLSTTLVIIYGDLSSDLSRLDSLLYIISTLVVLAVARASKNIGLTVLAGLVAYGVLATVLDPIYL